MAASTEARELELVGKVEMRIALAKDDKLESVLKPYLPPLLLKLASDHQSVRNKVCRQGPQMFSYRPRVNIC
jgi:proteasome component ECM29